MRLLSGLAKLFGRFANLGPDHILVRGKPVGCRDELAAVPARKPAASAALVVLLGDGPRADHPIGREVRDRLQSLIEPRTGDGSSRILLESLLYALDHDRPHHDPVIVIAGTDLVLWPCSFALGDHLANDRLQRLWILAAGAGFDFQNALHLLSPDNVHIGVREPDARTNAIHRKSVADGFAHRHGLADASAPEHHPVWPGAPHLWPDC